MKLFYSLIFVFISYGTLAVSASEKIVLQAAMQQYVESQQIEGALLDLDLESGEIRKLYPTKTHPMIMTMGENFVLCLTLSDTDGKEYLADYYIAPQDDGFVVIRTEINNRDALKKLMKAGIVGKMK